jgi:rhodanese-related sulfurtransferase
MDIFQQGLAAAHAAVRHEFPGELDYHLRVGSKSFRQCRPFTRQRRTSMLYAHRRFSFLFFVLMFLFSGMAAAQETPAQAPAGVKLVEAAEVQSLQGKGATLVDTRVAAEFAELTIKGAVSVPYNPEKSVKAVPFDPKDDKFDLAKLANKEAHIVVFCNSGTCWKSYKAAVALAKAGYKNVYWYRNGMPDWKARKLPTD